MEHTCVQTHSRSRPKAILKADSQFIHLSITSHEGPSPSAPGTIHRDTKRHLLPLSHCIPSPSTCLSLSCLFLLSPPLFFCMVFFFPLPSLNSSPDSHSVYMSVCTNPPRHHSHTVTRRQTLYKPRYSTLKWIWCISMKWGGGISSYRRCRCKRRTITRLW